MRPCLVLVIIACSVVHLARSETDVLAEIDAILALSESDKRDEFRAKLLSSEDRIRKSLGEAPNASAYFNFGRAFFYAEMDAKAISAFKAALKHDPKQSEAHFFLGLIDIYADDSKGAEEHFRSAIAINDRQGRYYFELAHVLYLFNRLEIQAGPYNRDI